jgi:hypothetical protein
VEGTWVADRGQKITFHADGTASIERFEWGDGRALDGPATWELGEVSNKPSVDGMAGVNGFHMAGVRTLADGFRLISYIGDPDQPKNLIFWSRR